VVQAKQQGFIGLNLIVFYMLPKTNLTEDTSAAKRAQDFFTGWYDFFTSFSPQMYAVRFASSAS